MIHGDTHFKNNFTKKRWIIIHYKSQKILFTASTGKKDIQPLRNVSDDIICNNHLLEFVIQKEIILKCNLFKKFLEIKLVLDKVECKYCYKCISRG